MPMAVDADERRKVVLEAAFRLVVAGGVGEVSLRKVAAEAGLNIGSVRHYFASHDVLLAAAAAEVGDRMDARLPRHPFEPSDRSVQAAVAQVQGVVEELLPLDEERHVELVVLSEFLMAARTKSVFRPMTERMAADMRKVLRAVLAAAGATDPDAEAERLTALTIGLSFDAVTPHGSLTPQQVRATLRHHLEQVLAAA